MLMRSKFSKQVMTRFEEKKDVTEQWALDNFSKHLKAYIEVREAADYQVNIRYKNTPNVTSSYKNQFHENVTYRRHTNKALLTG